MGEQQVATHAAEVATSAPSGLWGFLSTVAGGVAAWVLKGSWWDKRARNRDDDAAPKQTVGEAAAVVAGRDELAATLALLKAGQDERAKQMDRIEQHMVTQTDLLQLKLEVVERITEEVGKVHERINTELRDARKAA